MIHHDHLCYRFRCKAAQDSASKSDSTCVRNYGENVRGIDSLSDGIGMQAEGVENSSISLFQGFEAAGSEIQWAAVGDIPAQEAQEIVVGSSAHVRGSMSTLVDRKGSRSRENIPGDGIESVGSVLGN